MHLFLIVSDKFLLELEHNRPTTIKWLNYSLFTFDTMVLYTANNYCWIFVWLSYISGALQQVSVVICYLIILKLEVNLLNFCQQGRWGHRKQKKQKEKQRWYQLRQQAELFRITKIKCCTWYRPRSCLISNMSLNYGCYPFVRTGWPERSVHKQNIPIWRI